MRVERQHRFGTKVNAVMLLTEINQVAEQRMSSPSQVSGLTTHGLAPAALGHQVNAHSPTITSLDVFDRQLSATKYKDHPAVHYMAQIV